MVREFSTYNEGLVALRAWLVAEGATKVVMEATGVYWRPVWHVLEEEAGLELLLANARHVKNLPGPQVSMERPAPLSSKMRGLRGATYCSKEPTMPRLQRPGELVHVAFDASKNVLVAGVLRAGEETPTVERVANDAASVRRFVKKFPEPAKLRTCYEAGPGGYELHRLLASLKVSCQVIAPALIPLCPR